MEKRRERTERVDELCMVALLSVRHLQRCYSGGSPKARHSQAQVRDPATWFTVRVRRESSFLAIANFRAVFIVLACFGLPITLGHPGETAFTVTVPLNLKQQTSRLREVWRTHTMVIRRDNKNGVTKVRTKLKEGVGPCTIEEGRK